jgi:hypothetical protein
VSGAGSFLQRLLSGVAATLNVAGQTLNKLVQEAYKQGYTDGAEAMRDSILRAAGSPLSIPEAPPFSEILSRSAEADQPKLELKNKSGRAPRGTVGRILNDALTQRGGLTQHQLKQYADQVEDVSATSIGNELRRNEGKKYRREGKRWFLIESESSVAEAQSASATQEVYQPAA